MRSLLDTQVPVDADSADEALEQGRGIDLVRTTRSARALMGDVRLEIRFRPA